MSVRRRVELAVLAFVGATLPVLVSGGSTPAAADTASGYVTMVSESGDYIGQGIARTYRSNISYWVSETTAHVSAGPFTFDFAAPAGYALTPARYPGATRYPFQEPGEPGIDVSGDGRGCNTSTGFFTVLDLAPGRLWIVYEQHCEGGDAAVFGEIRLGYGEATAPLGVEAGILAFPSDYPGDTRFIVYCWGPGCNGATRAGLIISELGYVVQEMIGGFEYWAREGFPVDKIVSDGSGAEVTIDATASVDPLTSVLPLQGARIACDC